MRSGWVLEPANGTFDVTVAPGEDVQAAVIRCPRGGCVLLLPGTHAGPLMLASGMEVHVFGRGQATLQTEKVVTLISAAARATIDGLIMPERQVTAAAGLAGGQGLLGGVWILGGSLHLQACDLSSGILVYGGANVAPVIVKCRFMGPELGRGRIFGPDIAHFVAFCRANVELYRNINEFI